MLRANQRIQVKNHLRLCDSPNEDLSKLLLKIQRELDEIEINNSRRTLNYVSIQNESDKDESTVYNFQLESFTDAPDRATRVSYRFSASGHPIRDITIYLWDSQREVKVEGTSKIHVEALLGMISEDLTKKEVFLGMGGSKFRRIMKSVLFTLYLLLISLYIKAPCQVTERRLVSIRFFS